MDKLNRVRATDEARTGAPAPNSQRRILVVDDSDDTREMMAKLLEMEAFTVITAEDGSAGLNIATAELPDLIITDINMPNLNGIEMIRQLRKRPGFESVPIMAITAYGSGVAKEAIEAGADRATTKPVRFNALAVEIRELLFRAPSQNRPEPQTPAE